jgi:hypothetical protein
MDQCKPTAQHFFSFSFIVLLCANFLKQKKTYMGPCYLKIKLPLLMSTLKSMGVLVFQKANKHYKFDQQ